MNTKQIVGVVVIILGLIALLLGGTALNDVLTAESQMNAIGSLFGNMGHSGGKDLMSGFGMDEMIANQKYKAIAYIAVGLIGIGAGAFMAKKNNATQAVSVD